MKYSCRFSTILFALIILSTFPGCSKDDPAPAPTLEIKEAGNTINFASTTATRYLVIDTNIETVTSSSNMAWCSVAITSEMPKRLQITVDDNNTIDVREATITVKAGDLNKSVTVLQLGKKPVILLNKKTVTLDYKKQSFVVTATTNVNPEVSTSSQWLKIMPGNKSGLVDINFTFESELLGNPAENRQATIIFRQPGGDVKDSVKVSQGLLSDEVYNPVSTSVFEKDRKLKIISGTLTPADRFQVNENIEKSFDGNLNTLYHSPWAGIPANSPIELEYILNPEESNIANYVVLYPRSEGSNGRIKSATVWISTAEKPEFTQVGTFEAPNSSVPQVVSFTTPVINPRRIKVIVTDAYSHDEGKYYVSLAEIEVYESRSTHAIEADAIWFADNIFSALKPGTTLQNIASIQNPFVQNMAAYMLAGKYGSEYRIQNYEPYREVSDLARELKTSTYNQFENPTGIFFEQDEEIVVFVGNTNNEKISLRVRDFGSGGNDNSYPLREGLNILTMKGKGNGYISYYTPNYIVAENINIHIASGKVNGYFDVQKHSNEDGKRLLDYAVSEIMDIRGNRVQLAYSVNALSSNSYNKIKDLVELYDSIVSMQHSIMGLTKYNRVPKNRMFGRVSWSGYMFADGIGAGFNENTMNTVANPTVIPNSNWGIAHEFGHVNQTRPGMMWVGTTEVTNNIFSAWTQYQFTPQNLRLEHENIGGTIGGRFNAYLNNAIINKQEWGLQAGPDAQYGADASNVWGGDHFVKLAPLWQLQLFFHVAGQNNEWHRPYFWADIFEKVRNTNEGNLSHGQLQMNFVKNVCDAVSYDLTDFFILAGFLTPVDKIFGDYTNARKTITQSMVDETISYARKYPKPPTGFIHYISGNSLNAYKLKLPVFGEYNAGISGTNSKTISGDVWKNVTVFETYKDEVLTYITMTGTGSSDSKQTIVPYPTGSTRIEAVGWDGTRNLVFGNR
jgi:hypothetical protein